MGDTYSTVNNGCTLDDPYAVSPGSYYYLTFTHELGHALGMGHPHDGSVQFPGVPYNGTSNGGDNNLNATPWSVLTYNDVSATNGLATGYYTNYGYLENLGAFDIATAQYLYGPNLETNADDTTYKLDEYTLGDIKPFGMLVASTQLMLLIQQPVHIICNATQRMKLGEEASCQLRLLLAYHHTTLVMC